MRYRLLSPLAIQRATPSGIEEYSFEMGDLEVGDESEERFVLDLIAEPLGLANRITEKPSKKPIQSVEE